MKLVFVTAISIISFLYVPVLIGQSNGGRCTIKFSIAERDHLGNVNPGLSSDGQKWYHKKLANQYPNVCYVEQEPSKGIWFFIDTAQELVTSATARTTAQTNESGTTQSTTTVIPRETAYPVYTLKITRLQDGQIEVLRTFQRTNAGSGNGTLTGFIKGFSNPEREVISDAVKWLSQSQIPATIIETQQPTVTIKIINAKTNKPVTDENLNVALRVDQIGSVAMKTDKNGIINVDTGHATIIRILSNMYADCRSRGELYTNYSIAEIQANGITTGNLCSNAKPKAKPGELILFEIPKTYIPTMYPTTPAPKEKP